MLDLNHGNWPTVLLKDMSRLTNPNAAANTAAYRKGKGRASTTSTYPLGQGTLIQVDEVATRNAAL